MLKKALFLFFILKVMFANGQSSSGVLVYRQIIHQKNDTTLVSETLKELIFNQNESLSRTKGTTTFKGNLGTTNFAIPTSKGSKKGICYANFRKGTISSIEPAVTQDIFLVDTIGNIDWKIIDEFKYFGKLKCQRAEGNVRGRNWSVWFCTDIPVSAGPWKLYGLPGLILEAVDSSKRYKFLFESIEIPAPDNVFIEPLTPNDDQPMMNKPEFIKRFIQNSSNKIKMTESDPRLSEGRTSISVSYSSIEIFPGITQL